jgi:hypothetical protein
MVKLIPLYKDKVLLWFIYRILSIIQLISNGLSKQGQHHIRNWIPVVVSLCWRRIKD